MRTLRMMTLLCATAASASEGKWTPQQVLQQGPAWVKAQGFELPLAKLWDSKTNSGLLSNAVQLPGCSGSFVSADGLLITNHHCVVGILQEHSTPTANLGKDGFLAATRADEKPAKAFRIQVPVGFRDVTKEVLAAVPDKADDLARFRAVEMIQKQLVAECEKKPKTRCQFAAFDGGLFFTLTEFLEIVDVRLVYAPPVAVGDYGGETDNWTWPRHTGDFSLVRAYVDGQPFKPKYFFPVSKEGVKPGSAVAVLGYPGTSFRALLAVEMAEREQRSFPRARELATEWIQIIEEESKKNLEASIASQDDLRGLLNRRKNAEGQLAGLKRGNVLQKQAAGEAKVKAFAEKKEMRAALGAHEGLTAMMNERLATWERDFLLDAISWGPRALAWSTTLARRSAESVKADLEREPGFMERDLARLRERLERDQKRFAPAIERRVFVSWLKRALALPSDQRIAAVDAVFAGLKDDKAFDEKVNALLKSTVLEAEVRKKMFDETPTQLQARHDALLELGFAVDAERKQLKEKRDAWAGAVLRLRPEWRRAVLAEANKPVAPDANSTLRVTFGRVQGYSPRDALTYSPQTTLTGVLEKNTGVEPFDVPEKVRRAAADARKSAFIDRALGDVPVDFLSSCDTTGGNSGSPTIDGKGRLVGVNFDRVWENVANDFGYNPDVARNVNADVRYLLWILHDVEGASALLKELGVE